jgi:hypothetical protein
MLCCTIHRPWGTCGETENRTLTAVMQTQYTTNYIISPIYCLLLNSSMPPEGEEKMTFHITLFFYTFNNLYGCKYYPLYLVHLEI